MLAGETGVLMSKTQNVVLALAGMLALVITGCPSSSTDLIAGNTGDQSRLGSTASVSVLSPISDLSITGGAPVEVNWLAVATTNFAEVEVFFDLDQDPENGNELVAEQGIDLSTTTTIVDTTNLDAETYYIGVVLYESNKSAAYDYADGRITINQRSDLIFTSPRGSFTYDRTASNAPEFQVTWDLDDPDSTVSTAIYLDPDDSANGNEYLLRESDSQTGDSFAFSLPTSTFEAGTYRILAIVSGDAGTAEFYAPATIKLRSRLAGVIDLRDLDIGLADVEGAVFEGINPRDNLGSFVATGRDLDSDGYSEILLLAQFGKPGYTVNPARGGVGEAYLIYGRSDRFSGAISCNSTAVLFRGCIYEGVPEDADPIRPSRGITSFAVLSDWEGDGVREFAFGLPFVDSVSIGALDANGYFRSGVVVVASGSTLAPHLGFPGSNSAYIYELAEIGTLPHEPYVDPVCPEGFLGPKAPSVSGGSTYFLRHRVDAGGNSLGSLNLGCRISTNEPYDQFGETISEYEYDSLIMNAPNANPSIGTLRGPDLPGAGISYIFFDAAFNGFFPWSNVNAPEATDTYAGMPESAGYNLIPHGGPYHYILDATGYVSENLVLPIFPGYTVDADDSEPCGRTWAAAAPQISTTARIYGQYAGGNLGNTTAIGDFNSDGIRDFLVGNPLADEGAGACYIARGRFRNLVIGEEISAEELTLPMNGPDDPDNVRVFDGIQVVGAPGTRLGLAQDQGGDFNGDGLADVLIGSELLNNRRGGAAILFGDRELVNLTQDEIAFTEIPSRGLGVVFEGVDEDDYAGARVTTAGDVDGDGLDDILIAAPNRDVRLDLDLDGELDIDRTECGVVYLIYGSRELSGTISLADIGTEALPGAVFIGRYSSDYLGAGYGEQGDRSKGISTAGDVDGDGRDDLLLGSVSASPRDLVRAGEVYLIYGTGD